MMNNDSIEFDIKVDGKPAKTSIEEVEKAQDNLDKTVEKSSKNIQTNWKAIGAGVTIAAAAIGAMAKKSAELERVMFGLNEETKAWIKYASEQYGITQDVIGGFVQMGKAANLSGDTIEKMVEQGIAMSRQFANLNVDSAVEDLTEFYSTGEATGAVLEYLAKTTGVADVNARGFAENLKSLEEKTKGVNEEFAKTRAAKMDQLMVDLDNAALEVGDSFSDLADETGIVSGAVWVAKKAMDGLRLAFNGWMQIYYSAQKIITFDKDKLKGYDVELKKLAATAIDIRKSLGGSLDTVEIPEVTGGDNDGGGKTLTPFVTDRALASVIEWTTKIAEAEEQAKKSSKGITTAISNDSREATRIIEQFANDYNSTMMTAYDYELSMLDAQYAEYAKHVEDKAKLDEWYNQKRLELLESFDTQMQAYYDMGESLTDGLTRGILNFTETGKLNFKEMANSIIQDMLKIQIQSSMMSLFGGFNSTGGGLLGGAFSAIFNAKGNAFTNGQITPFATGGVVDSPTLFPMANGMGIMGEAGSEVIAPLKRDSSGNMGVGAVSPTVNVNVQNYGNDEVSISQDGNNIEVIISQIAASIQRGTGDVGKAIESRYGIRKA